MAHWAICFWECSLKSVEAIKLEFVAPMPEQIATTKMQVAPVASASIDSKEVPWIKLLMA